MKKGKYVRKFSNKYNRKSVLQFTLKGLFVKEWKTVGEIYRELGLDKSAILRCCKGKQKKSYHYIWKFKDEMTHPYIIKEKKNEDSGNSKELSQILLEVKKID